MEAGGNDPVPVPEAVAAEDMEVATIRAEARAKKEKTNESLVIGIVPNAAR